MLNAAVLTDRFDRALLYATHVHGGQVRKGTSIPYLAHLLAVAATVLEYGGSEDMAIAALLHDAVEDQGGEPRLSDIRNRFGDRVADNRRVAAQGLASVASTEREGVGDPAPASSSYRARLFEWFKKHPAASQDSRAVSEWFQRFVCAQQYWDRAMAEAIAGVRRGARKPLVVGIMGSGHIEYGDGVPYQLAALGINDVATALPWPADTDYPIHAPPNREYSLWYRTSSVTNCDYADAEICLSLL